jgi:hypothetical protein
MRWLKSMILASYLEDKGQEDHISRPAEAKSSRDPIATTTTNKKLDMVVYTCLPSYSESINRRLLVLASLGQN